MAAAGVGLLLVGGAQAATISPSQLSSDTTDPALLDAVFGFAFASDGKRRRLPARGRPGAGHHHPAPAGHGSGGRARVLPEVSDPPLTPGCARRRVRAVVEMQIRARPWCPGKGTIFRPVCLVGSTEPPAPPCAGRHDAPRRGCVTWAPPLLHPLLTGNPRIRRLLRLAGIRAPVPPTVASSE